MEKLSDGSYNISAKELEDLINKAEASENNPSVAKEEIKIMFNCTMQMLEVVGLSKDNKIDESILEKGGNPFPKIIKAGTGLFFLMGEAGMPGILGKKAKETVQKKFEFLGSLLPILQKYNNEFNGK